MTAATTAAVLILDDELACSNLISRVALKLGFDVAVTQDPTAFWRAYGCANPMLIVLDLNLPGTDGIEMLRYLAKRKCKSKILLVSGTDDKVISTAQRLGRAQGLNVVGALRKPFDLGSLRREIANACGRGDGVVRELRISPEVELRRAISGDELVVHYQPKVDVMSRRVLGAEALVRWQHPQHGLVLPEKIIPLAERTGLILPLTNWVLADAIARLGRWRCQGFDLKLAINIPAQALNDLAFPDQVFHLLDAHGLPGSSLTLEVTETSAMTNIVSAMDTLSRFRLKGIELSIDDFGSGYSSLVKLHKMPYSELKIDRSFVTDADVSEDSRVIVRTITNLAHNLGMQVVAEGVETREVWDCLRSWGCDIVQGYFISRPLAPAAFTDWLSEWRS
ncbi:MAG: EAL domain-containing protein [Dehalococcoidia bacterium]